MNEANSVLGTVDRWGVAGGTLAIALHGAVANRKTWLPLARELPDRFELWCPDLPGHGSRSSEPFTIASSLAMVRELVRNAQQRRIVIAGDSLGGYLALLAASAPDCGISAVCAGGCTWTMAGLAGILARATDRPVAFAERVLGARRLERLALALLPRVTDAETAAAVATVGLRIPARSESLKELAGLDLVAVIRAIRCPIVFVNGARDWPTRAGEHGLVRNAVDARIVLSPRTGHGVGLLDAPLFARAVVEAAAAI